MGLFSLRSSRTPSSAKRLSARQPANPLGATARPLSPFSGNSRTAPNRRRLRWLPQAIERPLSVFYIRYLGAELRRRKGRTILTATCLALGVGLVVSVTALSAGLDDAQSEVLEPLTGVGTEMSVSRPMQIEEGGPPPDAGGGPIGLDNLGKAGEKFDTYQYVSTDTSFPAAKRQQVAAVDGVDATAVGLTLSVAHVSGKVPEQSAAETAPTTGAPPTGSATAGGPPDSINFDTTDGQRRRHLQPRPRAADGVADHRRLLRLRRRRCGRLAVVRDPGGPRGRRRRRRRRQGLRGRRHLQRRGRRPVLRRLRRARPAAEARRPRGPRQRDRGPGGERRRGRRRLRPDRERLLGAPR